LEVRRILSGASFDEYNPATLRYMTLYNHSLLSPIRASIGGACIVGTSLLQLSDGYDAYCTTSTSSYAQIRKTNLTSQTTHRTRFPILNEVPNAERAASLVFS
jgi:hypothetical protein